MSIITRSKAKQIELNQIHLKAIFNIIEQSISCYECTNILTNPITLNCGHSFCQSCLTTNKKLISCPMKDCEVNTNTKHLVHDVTLIKLIELYTQWKSTCQTTIVDPKEINELLLPELECQLCFNLFLEPVTTNCGHTLCKQCFIRILDYNDKCPICRTKLPSYQNLSNSSTNKSITSIIQKLFPNLLSQRQLNLNMELQNRVEETPLFVCSLVFPKMPCYLHIFEPRYRLMIRRCIESQRQRFGMVLHINKAIGFHEYGTMLETRNIEVLPDGRYLLDAVGSFRFRVIEKGVRDGYNVGRIERIDDDDDDDEQDDQTENNNHISECQSDSFDELSNMSVSQLQSECIKFVEALKLGSAPWLFQRLNATVGPMPSDPSDFTFWIASIIPLDEQEKYELLPMTSVKQRFLLVLQWIKRLSEQWWFDRMCNIM